MANTRQAKKRVRQAEKARLRNASARSTMRTYIKKVRAAIVAGDKTGAEEIFKKAASVLDKVARKGLIHKNNAARHKSRLAKQIKEIA